MSVWQTTRIAGNNLQERPRPYGTCQNTPLDPAPGAMWTSSSESPGVVNGQHLQWPTPPQPPVVKVMVDSSCKRVMREDMSGCSDLARRRTGVHLVHWGNLEGTLLLVSASPSPTIRYGCSPYKGSNAAPHTFRQMSWVTMTACWVAAQFPQTPAKAKANSAVIPPAPLCVITKSFLSLPFFSKQCSSLTTNNADRELLFYLLGNILDK